MFKKIAPLLFCCFTIAFHAYAQQQIKSATVNFVFVEKNVEGQFYGFTSNTNLDWENISDSVLKGAVETETIKTGNFLRDWSLKGEKYFDADTYPKITFRSTGIKEDNNTFLVDGILTIKNIAKPIQFTFYKKDNHFLGKTTLFSSDFDITILKKGRDSNKVTIEIDLELE
ncbi:YceI family protein [Maribacter sp. CXY002]|uniref:YceI family protein n=1 Tax=Maribacter luteocoastalis TaxID=3407671 RepID=UPI003B67428A